MQQTNSRFGTPIAIYKHTCFDINVNDFVKVKCLLRRGIQPVSLLNNGNAYSASFPSLVWARKIRFSSIFKLCFHYQLSIGSPSRNENTYWLFILDTSRIAKSVSFKETNRYTRFHTMCIHFRFFCYNLQLRAHRKLKTCFQANLNAENVSKLFVDFRF